MLNSSAIVGKATLIEDHIKGMQNAVRVIIIKTVFLLVYWGIFFSQLQNLYYLTLYDCLRCDLPALKPGTGKCHCSVYNQELLLSSSSTLAILLLFSDTNMPQKDIAAEIIKVTVTLRWNKP